jgi:hypothetical protein
MASTNKTTHYELSQFLGTDKPAWLTDYNSDMSKIDTGINTAQSTATAADGKSDANTTAIGTLENLTTDAKTSLVAAINEVDGHADTAQNTANNANTNAGAAISSLQNLETYLTLGTQTTYLADATHNQITTNQGTMASSSITVSRNSTGTLGKVYGTIRHKPNSTGTQTIYINFDTGLRPDTDITISPVGEFYGSTSSFNSANMPVEVTLKVKTNGYVEISYYAEFVPANFYFGFLFPSLYFIKDWGDAPTPA